MIFVTFLHICRKYHISPCIFWKRSSFIFRLKKKYHITRKIIFSAIFLERPSFQNIWRKYHISMCFFWEKSSFIVRLMNKIIFSGKKNHFPDNTRKIIFQRKSFGKTIFSEHLEKENMVSRAVVSPTNSHINNYRQR